MHGKLSQIIQYLASSEMELGIILNFGFPGKLQSERVALTQEARERHDPEEALFLPRRF